MTGSARDRGYAMLAAVGAVAFFGYLSLEAIAGGRSAVVSASAELERAQLAADADAGVTMAINGLNLDDPARRWSLAGGAHVIDFDGAVLTILVEDESGKVPLNYISRPQVRRLFDLAGADPALAGRLTDALLALRDGPEGAGTTAAHGPLTAIDELALLPGMTPALYARIAPAITINAVALSFDPRTASPLALAVMAPDLARPASGPSSPAVVPPPAPVSGRTVTIRVDVADDKGDGARRTEIVEFTGARNRPYLIRSVD
jgi:general secretion pathway protein K